MNWIRKIITLYLVVGPARDLRSRCNRAHLEDSDVIGFALEKRPHSSHRIELTNNVIPLDSPRPSRLLHRRQGTPEPSMTGNLIVGRP
jgi:hypothetical protein